MEAKRLRLDLPVLTDSEKGVVLIQYTKDNSAADAEAVLLEYLRFMRIKMGERTPGECAPSKKIDAMWHAHILSTKEYSDFCDRHNGGEFIHHDPTKRNGQSRYELTLRRYSELFGQTPSNNNIWPPQVDEAIAPEEQKGSGEDEVRSGEEESEGNSEENDSNEESESEDSMIYSESSHDSWYGDGKGDTKKARKQWHQDYARQYDPEAGCGTWSHEWIDGQYNVHCEDCREESRGLEDVPYGDGKGDTRTERVEWHKMYALRHEREQQMGPKHGDPNSYCGCLDGHKWRDGEFEVTCEMCKNSSDEIDSFSCG